MKFSTAISIAFLGSALASNVFKEITITQAELEDISESDYEDVKSFYGDLVNRPLSERAPLLIPDETYNRNGYYRRYLRANNYAGYYCVYLRVPPESNETYCQVAQEHRQWLKSEIEKDKLNGYHTDVTFSGLRNCGNFSQELLAKIRNRSEVAVVHVEAPIILYHS